MRRTDGFARTLAFAALAALALPAAWLLLAPLLGVRLAFGLPLLAALAWYAIGLAPDRRSAVSVGVLVAFLGCPLLALAATRGEVAFGAAVILAVARSGLLFRARPLRAIALECGLVGGGLALAALVSGPGPLGSALGLWSFGLVQAAYFLVGGSRRRPGEAERRDPFDTAHAGLQRLLEEEPGLD